MEEATPTHSDNTPQVILKHEFHLFRVWRQLPVMLKRPPADTKTGFAPSPVEFAEAMGIDDEMVLELVQLPTQKSFAEKYGVSVDTLVDWGKKLELMNEDDEMRRWARKLTKNLLFSLYNHAMRKGNPLNFKLFLEYVQKWAPNLKIDTNYHGVARIVVKKDPAPIAAPEK